MNLFTVKGPRDEMTVDLGRVSAVKRSVDEDRNLVVLIAVVDGLEVGLFMDEEPAVDGVYDKLMEAWSGCSRQSCKLALELASPAIVWG